MPPEREEIMEALERYENKIEKLKADLDYAKNAIRYMMSETSQQANDAAIVGEIALNHLEGEDNV
jgi:archaellum component FlaC